VETNVLLKDATSCRIIFCHNMWIRNTVACVCYARIHLAFVSMYQLEAQIISFRYRREHSLYEIRYLRHLPDILSSGLRMAVETPVPNHVLLRK
jgi:hypothetical protein